MGGAASDAVATVIERAPELFLREAAPAQRAAVAVERILRASRLALIPALDRALRDGGLHRRLGRSFLEVTPSQVARLDRLPEGPRCAALGIASLLRSGHVREAAVDGLAPLRGDPLAAALLINRLNDYVGVVADRAWAALEDRLHASLAGVMVQALPLVERMGAWVRAGELRRGRLRAFFLMEERRCRDALWGALRAADGDVVGAAARLLAERHAGAPELVPVLAAALECRDPRVRRWAARCAADRRVASPAVLEAIAPHLAADRLPALRVIGVGVAAHRGDLEALRRAAFDGNAEVRHHARVHLAAAGAALDYRSVALEALGRLGLRRDAAIGALATLSDFGRAEDRPRVAPFAGDPRPRVAREAARTLAMLDAIGG